MSEIIKVALITGGSKFFFLTPLSNAITPSISQKYFTPVTVKTYGPFFNVGGGDAKGDSIYVIFYKAVPKPPKGK